MAELRLETQNLIIRKLKPSDLANFLHYRSNPIIAEYQSFDVMSEESAEEFIIEQQGIDFKTGEFWSQYGIELRSESKIIGDCAIKLDELDQRIGEIGVTIATEYQRKGYATEVLYQLMKFLFEEHKIHRIVETASAENSASINLLEKIGFRKEGHFIENHFVNGKWESEVQYAMLKSEFKQATNHLK
ncbi:MAG: GNAT family N-acetyltransferase [Flavobacterium sp.]|nr:GNAT family N-acetyltransferase [Flavobacterium sp.]